MVDNGGFVCKDNKKMYWEIVRLIRSVSFHKNQVREVEREGEGGGGQFG